MITVFVPKKYLTALEVLISDGHFPNRSEAIRTGIRDLIRNELILSQEIDADEIDKEIEKMEESE